MPCFIKNYFHFTRGERNGSVILVTIMVLVFAFPHAWEYLKPDSEYEPDPEFMAELMEFYGLQNNFKSGNDFDTVPANINNKPGFDTERETLGMKMQLIDLNSADTAELMQLRGIGPVLSQRILRYRDVLGGYFKKEQLIEVYGINRDLYDRIEQYVFTDTAMIVRLRLLTDDFGVILRHPYIDFEQVSYIFRLRNSGGLNSCEELFTSPDSPLEDDWRLAPYIILD